MNLLQFAAVKSLKIFTVCEICPTNHLKAKKMEVTKATSWLSAILCFLPLSQIWSYEFFFYQQALESIID